MAGSSTLGVVSFLNARPLIAGLDRNPAVALRFAVPSALPQMLRTKEVSLALIPVVDLARKDREFKIVSDGCIASDGETMTVRVFSRVRPEEISTLHVDGDSHTSVLLSRLIWRVMYRKQLEIRPFEPPASPAACESVMLIGDKVVTCGQNDFPHQIDLGGAWKAMTGLPFVFAVWAGRAAEDVGFLEPVLTQARDRGVSQAAAIAATQGPELGWPAQLAREYLVNRLKYRLDDRMRDGLHLFLQMARQYGYLPSESNAVPV